MGSLGPNELIGFVDVLTHGAEMVHVFWAQRFTDSSPEYTDVCWDNKNVMYFLDYDDKLLIWNLMKFLIQSTYQSTILAFHWAL